MVVDSPISCPILSSIFDSWLTRKPIPIVQQYFPTSVDSASHFLNQHQARAAACLKTCRSPCRRPELHSPSGKGKHRNGKCSWILVETKNISPSRIVFHATHGFNVIISPKEINWNLQSGYVSMSAFLMTSSPALQKHRDPSAPPERNSLQPILKAETPDSKHLQNIQGDRTSKRWLQQVMDVTLW